MNIITNIFGPEITLKHKISLDLQSPTLRDLLRELKNHHEGTWGRIIKDDLSIEEGCVILVNGRNISSLEKLETEIHDGDEITLTVLVAGG